MQVCLVSSTSEKLSVLKIVLILDYPEGSTKFLYPCFVEIYTYQE